MKDKSGNTRVWVDIITPPQVHFFHSLLDTYTECDIYTTVRKKAETVELYKQYGSQYKTIGKDYSISYLKYWGIIARTIKLLSTMPEFDISICFQNAMCSLVSRLRDKYCIMFDDNDYRVNQPNLSFPLKLFVELQAKANFYIVPKVCYKNFKKVIPEQNLISFDGYKEDVTLASYVPNQNFLKKIPFKKFIIIRPEALEALYVKGNSIVPQLIRLFQKENINIILLPRINHSYYREKYQRSENIYIPYEPLNGLDLCYYSNAVLTGSGTMAREAACMGRIAVSFFPGRGGLLSVDEDLVKKGKIFHSREPQEICNYVNSVYDSDDRRNNMYLSRSKNVKREVINLLKDIIFDISR